MTYGVTTAIFMFLRFAMVAAIGAVRSCEISPNTEIAITNAVKAGASSRCLPRNSFTKKLLIATAAPESCTPIARIAPKSTGSPMLPRLFPKEPVMLFRLSIGEVPKKTERPIAVKNSAIKLFIFSFKVRTSRITIDMISASM